MIRICLMSSSRLKSAKFLSGQLIRFASGNDVTNQPEQQCQSEKFNKLSEESSIIKLSNEHLKNPDKLTKLLRCDSPVEGEPVPPSKNPYINFKDLGLKAFRPVAIDESKTSFFMFPGQGSQFVGMGKKLLESDSSRRIVEKMFNIAGNILGYDLEEVCLQGPEAKLNQTLYAQPAIFVTSLADNPGIVESCIGAAGFSLGELTALTFSGALSFENGLRLVKFRAEEMQKACENTTGGLLTVIYGRDGKVDQACKAAEDYCRMKGIDSELAVCKISNYLFPHCRVIGGHLEALNFIYLNAKDFGIKRCKKVMASGAFHTKYMLPALKRFRSIVNSVPLDMPTKVPVYSNLDGLPYITELDVRSKLPNQMVKPVRWEQTMFIVFSRQQHEAHPWIFECGPGTNLISILKNVNARAYLKAKHIDV